MIIRDDQTSTFRAAAIDNYAQELTGHCREFAPQLCQTLHENELRAAIRQGVARAREHGFTLRGPVRCYVDLMIALGNGFDTDPLYPWAAEILAQGGALKEMERAQALHSRACDYLTRVDGEGNLYRLQAVEALLNLYEAGITFRPATFEPDLIAMMRRVHPRKVEEAGERPLRQLIAAAVAKSKGYGFRAAQSFGTMAGLMFAFGHQCDADPFLPWIGRTLNQVDPANPDATAGRLERRAVTWFTAVLRNVEVHA